MSAISPDLRGDIKTSQNSFLLEPASRASLNNSRVARNFWVNFGKGKVWSAAGVSKDLKQLASDKFSLQAGLLWQKVTRVNRKIGLKAEILSFIPAGNLPVEIMQVTLTNISAKKIQISPIAAIPIYGRAAQNLRDHRHVTSLLQRIKLHKFGVIVKPTLSFNEAGHQPNKSNYFVLGWDEREKAPEYIYSTQEMFCGESGDLEAPQSLLKNLLPDKSPIQGKEAIGALRFTKAILAPGSAKTYIILLGITKDSLEINKIIRKFESTKLVLAALKQTKEFWAKIPKEINLDTGNAEFDNWFCWVSIQPLLRKIFGCSFLPDFDYGLGGRGWRDLWQDCFGLILYDPQKVRELLIANFAGVRIDGSNATIIGKKSGEFIADRNNISRVWMDHGVWPLLTLDLYLQETADYKILFKQVPYFRDHQLCRCREKDAHWNSADGQKLKTASGRIYYGSILEHLLVENLVQFFNVGTHNHIRLEGGDWNDGLDMAKEKGESVAFSAMYAQNLEVLAGLLLKTGRKKILLAEELKILLAKVDYNNIKPKQAILKAYFNKAKMHLCGKQAAVDVLSLAADLKYKSCWLIEFIRRREWLKEGFFNGYYDNRGKRVEGKINNLIRICLASQVFPIMSGAADERQLRQILAAIDKYLRDKKSGGIRLNSDFKAEQLQLGRAFSFVYGDKENGAFFNHMIVMLAYALYQRGYVQEGWQALNSIFRMAVDKEEAKIYPCLPEYFNAQGKGMYSYLTGSASWFILTLLTQVFGIKGKDGGLLIEPKLTAEQFRRASRISINRSFAGRKLVVSFLNPRKLEFNNYRIIKAMLNKQSLMVTQPQQLFIPRSAILKLPQGKVSHLEVILG